jgi:hypothetical protein
LYVSVVIPAKEEPYLDDLLTEVHRSLRCPHELLVQREPGLSSAVLCGVRKSKGEIIVVLDADGSHNPKYLNDMLGFLSDYSIVIGSRYVKGGGTQDHIVRQFLSRMFCAISKIFLNLDVRDTMSGFVIAKREVFETLKLKPIGYKFALELVVKSKGRFKIMEFPIAFEKRKKGVSKTGMGQGIKTLAFLGLLFFQKQNGSGGSSEQGFIYLKFDLTSLPLGANVVSANLEVYLSNTGGSIYAIPADKIGAYYCSDNSWTESGINWNNKPSFNPTPTDTWSFGIIYYVGEYKSWDVTADVKTAFSSGIITEVLKFQSKTGDGYAYFAARETGAEPKLTVEYFILLEDAQTSEGAVDWYWTGNTAIQSVAVSDVDSDGSVEIITGGSADQYAQLCAWNGSDLALEDTQAWHWGSGTWINSVAIGDVDADNPKEIVTGGYYYDGARNNAQLTVWGTT